MSEQSIEMPPNNLGPAGFWIRSGAYLIDTMVCIVPTILLRVMGFPIFTFRVVFLNTLIVGTYSTYMFAACRGQTFGMRAAGIAVVRNDGSGLSYGRAFLRWIGMAVSGLLFGIGYWMIPFTNQKRALHDLIADTRVIYVSAISAGRKAMVIGFVLIIPVAPAILGFGTGVVSSIYNRRHSLNGLPSPQAQHSQSMSGGSIDDRESKRIHDIIQAKIEGFPRQARDSAYARACIKRNLELFPAVNTESGIQGLTLNCICAADQLIQGTHFSNIEAEIRQGKLPGEIAEFWEAEKAIVKCNGMTDELLDNLEKEMVNRVGKDMSRPK